MIIKNGLIFTADSSFKKMDLAFENDKITQMAPQDTLSGGDVIDAKGAYVLPGFIDMHTHGVKGYDISDADAKGIETMLNYYGEQGVTTVVPSTMSYSEEILTNIIKTALPYFEKSDYGAVMRGINMEGPFINVDKKGAQNAEYIIDPNETMFERLYTLANGYVKLIHVAPELKGSIEFINQASQKCVVSLAHTEANYQQAIDAFNAGARNVTHLYNAMPPFNHREPGVIGAASDKASYVELISDGFHIHPSVIRATFEWFGKDRVCLISDSMRACGMPNGTYSLGGQEVFMNDGKATLASGTIAGSATCLADICRRAIKFMVPIEKAFTAVTINPAKAVNIFDQVGSLEVGKQADILLWDSDLNTQRVIVGGKTIVSA